MEGTQAFAAFGRLGPGAMLGGYTIVRSAGRGGMGVVWEAETRRGERVAIKTMFPALAMRAELDAMFVTEGSVASRIDHPNVCRVLDVGDSEGIRFQIMEWMDGDSLAALLEVQGGRLPYGIAARIALDVARGLDAAHAAGVVHRDVSPHNVLLDRSGRAVIADFGVAKVAHGAGSTASGIVKGKVRYMAPEQAYSEPVDARTDVYALGLVLYEATTGASPFASESDLATLTMIASLAPIPPPDAPGYPEALRAVVVKATQKDAAARYTTANEFADALEAALVGTTHADVATLLRATFPPPAARARRRGWLTGTMLSLVACVVLVVVMTERGHVHHPATIAEQAPSPPAEPRVADEPTAATTAAPLPAPPPPKPERRSPSRNRAPPPVVPVVAAAASGAPPAAVPRDVLRARD